MYEVKGAYFIHHEEFWQLLFLYLRLMSKFKMIAIIKKDVETTGVE